MSDCAVQKNTLRMRFNTWKYRIRYFFSKNNYEKKLEVELAILREQNEELIIEDFVPLIRKATRIFSKQGHSGGSAPYFAGALGSTIKKVLLFEPLSPVTGKDSEWGTACNPRQNKRLSALFKDEKGAYYLNAIVWQGEDEWDTFTGSIEGVKSSQYVKFPFTPKTFYIDVTRKKIDSSPDDAKSKDAVICGDGSYVYSIKDRKQLKEVFEYYMEQK